MQGEIALTVALTAYGNHVLGGGSARGFWPGHPLCKHCAGIRFIAVDPRRQQGDTYDEVIAPDPGRWFGWLQREGTRALVLHHGAGRDQRLPDHISVAFAGGGGEWLIEAQGERSADLWLARWDIIEPRPVGAPPWRVSYGRLVARGARLQSPRALDEALVSELQDTLDRIAAFAHRQQCDNFALLFDRARMVLAGRSAELTAYRPSDLVPAKALPPPARRVFEACAEAWVFGGMGSWNDRGFDGDAGRAYDELSQRLFALVNAGIVAAVNAVASR